MIQSEAQILQTLCGGGSIAHQNKKTINLGLIKSGTLSRQKISAVTVKATVHSGTSCYKLVWKLLQRRFFKGPFNWTETVNFAM